MFLNHKRKEKILQLKPLKAQKLEIEGTCSQSYEHIYEELVDPRSKDENGMTYPKRIQQWYLKEIKIVNHFKTKRDTQKSITIGVFSM